jgi:multiple sugar transport system permease protein
MAACIVTMLPVVAVFFLAQKRFIEGISLSGLKG